MALPDKQSYDQLGGELADYSPVTDPTTDLSAESDNETRVDVANMTRTAIRAYVSFTVNGSTITINNTDYDAVYGNSFAYKPTIGKAATGRYSVTFPTSIVDARGKTHYLNLNVGWCNSEDTSASYAHVIKISPNVFEVRNFNSSGALADPSGSNIRLTLFVL